MKGEVSVISAVSGRNHTPQR